MSREARARALAGRGRRGPEHEADWHATPRLRCLIDGCRRSSRNREGYTEWLCRRHWRSVDRSIRDDYMAARKLYRAEARRFRAGLAERPPRPGQEGAAGDMIAAGTRALLAWEAVRADARIKAAFGVDGAGGNQRRMET